MLLMLIDLRKGERLTSIHCPIAQRDKMFCKFLAWLAINMSLCSHQLPPADDNLNIYTHCQLDKETAL